MTFHYQTILILYSTINFSKNLGLQDLDSIWIWCYLIQWTLTKHFHVFLSSKNKNLFFKTTSHFFSFFDLYIFFLFINLYTAGISKNPKPTPMSCGVGKQSRVERGHQRQHNTTHPKAASCIWQIEIEKHRDMQVESSNVNIEKRKKRYMF